MTSRLGALAGAACFGAAAVGSVGCSSWEAGDQLQGTVEETECPRDFDPALAEENEAPNGFRVTGNRIEDSRGREVVLRGVNRSGTEYECLKGTGVFDGEADETAVRALSRWNVNAVRVPLTETCWLGINGVADGLAGDNYKLAIRSFVARLQKYGIIPILDLHWAAPGDELPEDLWPMPNTDHSERFWADVAETFLDNDGVIFEPYNEPFPDGNRDSEAAWQCWRDGCENVKGWGTSETYQTVGMQALVDAIRSTGSEHLILLGGVQYSNSLARWLEYKPDDPAQNLAAAWHIYNFNACSNEACWNGAPAELAEQYPIVVTELGQDDCNGDFISPLVQWLDERRLGYLAWAWNAYGPCTPGNQTGRAWSLVTDYYCPVPNSEYASTFYQLLAGAE